MEVGKWEVGKWGGDEQRTRERGNEWSDGCVVDDGPLTTWIPRYSACCKSDPRFKNMINTRVFE